MPDKNVQLPDGRVVSFPDSMADADISAVIKKQLPQTAAVGSQAQPGWLDKVKGFINTLGPPEQSPESKQFFLQLAGTGAGMTGGTQAASMAKEALPSAERAGQTLKEVKGAAGDVPINMEKPGNTALDLYEQSQRGATLPKVVRDFVKRATLPEGEPITYAEAKDFQSNVSALSAEERMATKPNTLRLIGKLNADLKDSLEEAADTVGKGQQFTQAMKEYHHAMQLRGLTDAAKAYAWKAALGGVGVAAGKTLWDWLSEK